MRLSAIANLALSCVLLASGAAGEEAAQDFENEYLQDRKLAAFYDVLTITRGFSPTAEGIASQYRNSRVSLRGNVTLSDVIVPGARWHTGKGLPTTIHDITQQTPENYHDSHNHYQNLFVETLNLTQGANGISIWGDSRTLTHGANVWGGFLSARSTCAYWDEDSNQFWDRYVPEHVNRNCTREFDAQLTGLEVDVLNDGLPGVWPNKAKHGVQVVGFGNPNSHAFSVIVENFDRERQYQSGHFESILYAQNSLSDYGRFLVGDFDKGEIGIDFRKPIFTRGALAIRTNTHGEGIVINNALGGEIYGGKRRPNFHDQGQWLTLKAGEGGLRIVSSDNTKEILAVDNFGGVYLSGDLFWNGKPVTPDMRSNWAINMLLVANGILMISLTLVLWMRWRKKRR